MNLILRCNLILLLSINLLLFNYSYAAKQNSDSKDDFNEFNEFDQLNEVDKSSEEIQLTEDDFIYLTPDIEQEKYYLFEHFDDERQYTERWIKSLASKSDSKENKYDGEWLYVNSHPKLKGDYAIMMNSKAKHHAISSRLLKKFEFKRDPLVVQYEVQFRNGQECGGAYIKLLSSPVKDLHKVNDETPYTIMFGPDKCGGTGKLHFIFKHKNPKNGTVREIHFNKANALSNKLSEVFKDGKWHVFRLVIRPDNSFEIQVDKKVLAKGSLLEDFEPSVNPPKEIEDPSEKKPEDYDDREKIPDPEDRKPSDWDESEPRKIADPKAKKPDNWDQNVEWKPPLIDNPKFKGKWKPRLISNPDYKGPWKAKIIKNPNYYNDQFPFKMASIDSVAFELWSISDGIAFDNVLITDSVDVANYILDHTQLKKDLLDSETDNLFIKLIKETNKKPYLWLIYFAVIAIPVILFIGYCCVTPGRKSQDQTAKSKKKDDSSEQLLNEEIDDEQPSTSSGARLRKTKRVD